MRAAHFPATPIGMRNSFTMGRFVFIPAYPLGGGCAGELRDGIDVIPLLWSASVLTEFAAAMDGIEEEFLRCWSEGEPTRGVTDGRMKVPEHA